MFPLFLFGGIGALSFLALSDDKPTMPKSGPVSVSGCGGDNCGCGCGSPSGWGSCRGGPIARDPGMQQPPLPGAPMPIAQAPVPQPVSMVTPQVRQATSLQATQPAGSLAGALSYSMPTMTTQQQASAPLASSYSGALMTSQPQPAPLGFIPFAGLGSSPVR